MPPDLDVALGAIAQKTAPAAADVKQRGTGAQAEALVGAFELAGGPLLRGIVVVLVQARRVHLIARIEQRAVARVE
jgi:hypothetical protein